MTNISIESAVDPRRHARSLSAVLSVLFVSVVVFISPALAQTRDDPGIIITNGLATQAYMGTGKGVTVSIVDGGVDVTHPALRGSVYLQKDFTGQKILDDDKNDDGHGTGIAAIILGHDGKVYHGIAPSARFINARVVTTGDRTSDLYTGAGLIWSARSGANIANISIGNKIGGGRLTDQINLIADYLTERYQMNIVTAAGNENATAVQQAPGGNYNGLSIGALGSGDYWHVAAFSNHATSADERSKPDLVAPGQAINIAAANWEKSSHYVAAQGTSFAAPMVAGVMAQMIGYGKGHRLPTDPLLLKSILMTSATKVYNSAWGRWTPRDGFSDQDYNYLYDQPLDAAQGAGRLDAMAAYRLYAKQRSKSTPYNLWGEGKMKGNQTVTYKIGTLGIGQRVDATLTWYRHVTVKDLDGDGLDAQDRYTATSLADFTLVLLRNGVPVAASDSDVDNLEHLSWTLTRPGDYSLEVYRFDGSGITKEPYAMSARVLRGDAPSLRNYTATTSTPADAGNEGWASVQRGMTMVPEPHAIAVILAGLTVVLGRRRR